MTGPEVRAWNAGIRAALALAETAATRLKASPTYRPGRGEYAVAALAELAEAGRGLLVRPPDPVRTALAKIADEPGDAGEMECPACRGRLRWSRAPENGHVWGRCETDGCLAWLQ